MQISKERPQTIWFSIKNIWNENDWAFVLHETSTCRCMHYMYHDAFQIIHILDFKRSTASTLEKKRKTVKLSNKSNIKTKQMLYNSFVN